MGNYCCFQNDKNNPGYRYTPSSRTPLLATGNVPKHNQPNVGFQPSYTLAYNQNSSSQQGFSITQNNNRPTNNQQQNEIRRSSRNTRRKAHEPDNSNAIQPMLMRPTRVSNVDKTLKDHGDLFNLHLARYTNLCGLVEEMKNLFPKANENRTLLDCFRHVKILCNPGSVQVKQRFKFCYEIEYDGQELHYSVIPAFIAFNKSNKLMKEILDRGAPLVSSVKIVIENERELTRDVLVASLGSEGQTSMKNLEDNLSDLRKVSLFVSEIETNTKVIFKDLKRASDTLLDLADTPSNRA